MGHASRVWTFLTSRALWEQIVGGLVVAAVVGAMAWVIGTDDEGDSGGSAPRSTTASPRDSGAAQPSSSGGSLGDEACGSGCLMLTVVDTVVNGRDDGLYVMDCYTGSCERLALAELNDRVYAQCRVEDGLDVEGISTWVRTPWAFVPGSVASDGSARADATGVSDPASDTFGWVSARYLEPNAVIAQLPLCE